MNEFLELRGSRHFARKVLFSLQRIIATVPQNCRAKQPETREPRVPAVVAVRSLRKGGWCTIGGTFGDRS